MSSERRPLANREQLHNKKTPNTGPIIRQFDSMLSFRTKAFYGMGQMIWGVKDTLFHFYLIFYYQQNLGLSGTLAGAAAFSALFFDAVSDPIMAYVSDHHHSRWGRRHPFMAFSILPFAGAIFFLFNPPDGMGQIGLFLWLACFAILARLFVTIFIVPHMALSAELSSDYQERTSVFGYRVGFGYISSIILQGIALRFLLPEDLGGTLYTEGYGDVGLLAATMAVAAGVATVWGTLDRVPHLPKAPSERPPLKNIVFDVFDVFKVKNFRAFMGGSVQFSIIIGVAETLIFHLLTFYYQFSSAQQSILIMIIFTGLVPGYFVAQYAVRRFGKPKATVWLLIIGSILGSTHPTLHLFGFLPESGSDELLITVCGIVMVNQTFIIAYLIVQGSMIGDMADEYATISNRRQEALFAAAQTFAQKLTFGGGALLAGIIIDIAGFTEGMQPGDVPADTLFAFGLLIGPGLFILSMLAVVPYLFYDLDQERLAALQASLHDAPQEQGATS